jgi:Skp family chaperone for outer membrane proteins
MTDVKKTLQDAGYVLVGLGVIGFQKAQVRRHELTKEFEGRTKDLETQLAEVRAQVAKLSDRIEPVLQEIEGRIPEQVAELVKQARSTAKELQARLAGSTNGSRAAA